MSWSFNALGSPAAVSKRALAAKTSGACMEPEESYRQACLDYIATAASQIAGDGAAVQVAASGSMWKDGDTVKSHNLSLNIAPLYGLVVD